MDLVTHERLTLWDNSLANTALRGIRDVPVMRDSDSDTRWYPNLLAVLGVCRVPRHLPLVGLGAGGLGDPSTCPHLLYWATRQSAPASLPPVSQPAVWLLDPAVVFCLECFTATTWLLSL